MFTITFKRNGQIFNAEYTEIDAMNAFNAICKANRVDWVEMAHYEGNARRIDDCMTWE